MQKISCSPMAPCQNLCHERYRHLQAAAAAPSSIPIPAALMPKSDLPAMSIEARGWAKTTLIHFDILLFYQCRLASLWAFGFILHQTTQRCPRAGCQMCSIYFYSLITCDGSSQTETSWGARSAVPAALHALLWTMLSKRVDHVCDTSGNYFGDELVVPPSIWAWDAKLCSKHLKDQQGGCCNRDSRCELGMWGSRGQQR